MPEEISDEELIRRHAEADAPNRAFMQIYYRYREPVLGALEAGGLTHVQAMLRLAAVFIRALDLEPGSQIDRPLKEHLMATAAEVLAAHQEDEMASEENATRPAHEEATEMLDLADRMFFDLPPEERLEAVGEYIASVAQVYQRRNAEMPDWLKLLIGRGTR